jgi:NADPH2:quinone reductase
MPEHVSGRAARIDRYGPPAVLKVVDVVMSPPGPREVRLQTLAAGVNYTDLQIRAGLWPTRKPDPFPYTPGIEVVGRVVAVGREVTGWASGALAMTMMQGLGGVRAERPGAHAEFVSVDADALAHIPENLDPLDMAAIGLPGVTAWMGLRRIRENLQGLRLLVTGAAGNVGSAAVRIAKAQDATVIALVSGPAQAETARALGADEVIVSPRTAPVTIEPRSVDGVFDTVGGPVFGACVAALRPGGILSTVGAAGGGAVVFDVWALIAPVTLTGYSTETLDGADLRKAIAALGRLLQSGGIVPPPYTVESLENVATVHARIEAGDLTGRVLLVPERR